MQLPDARGTIPRIARLIVLAILIGIGISHVIFAIRDWPLHDMDVYLTAAKRLRDGQELYVAGDSAVSAFWYSPWYAVVWIPLTYLPRDVVAIGWSAILIGATGVVCWLLSRRSAWGVVVAVLIGPPLFAVSAGGNIQSLMVLALLVGFHRSWGPVAVAAIGSLKLTPFLLVAVYVARREWWKAGISIVLGAVLLVPGLLMGMVRLGIEWDAAPALLGASPVLYGLLLIGAVISVFVVPARFALLAAATATILALPRLFIYDATIAVVGLAGPGRTARAVDQRIDETDRLRGGTRQS